MTFQYTYDQGISSRTSFLILAIFHLLTLVSTFLFLPKGFIKKPPEPSHDGQNQDSETSESVEKLPPLRSLVLSPTYLFYLYWTVVLQFRFLFVVSSLNVTLESLLGSKNEVSRYTDITAYILLGGLVVAPLVGAFYAYETNRYRESNTELKRKLMPLVLPLAFGTSSGVLLSAVVFIQKPEVIYMVYVFLITFRAFIYTIIAALPIVLYPGEYYGFMFGSNRLLCAMMNLLQYPLFTWGTKRSFDEVNIFLMVLTASTYIYPLHQWWVVYKAGSRSEDEDRLQPAANNTSYKTFKNSVDKTVHSGANL